MLNFLKTSITRHLSRVHTRVQTYQQRSMSIQMACTLILAGREDVQNAF